MKRGKETDKTNRDQADARAGFVENRVKLEMEQLRKCQSQGCEHAVPAIVEEVSDILQALQVHNAAFHPLRAGGGHDERENRGRFQFVAPTIQPNSTDEQWSYFVAKWERYKRASGMSNHNCKRNSGQQWRVL